MLEYFTYRKFKKHKEAKEAGAKEVLDSKDEKYFESVVDDPQSQEVPFHSSADSTTSASPSAVATPADGTPATSEAAAGVKKHTWRDTVSEYATGTYDKAKHVKLPDVQVPAFLNRKGTTKDGEAGAKGETSKKDKKGKGKAKEEEETYYSNLTAEEKELHNALDSLSLAAQDGKALSLSPDTRALLQKFTQILKDMVNGVPTAYDDLINLFETKSKQIDELFESTPGFLKTMAKKIPGALGLGEKVVAEEAAGPGAAGLAAQAATFGIPTLKQLVTNPSAVSNALKTVVNAIKLRFPGIALGTNVVLSMALFVLLFVFWYCYKRGKEVRLEKEAADREEEEAKLAESVLEGAPPVPTTDPASSITTTTETPIDGVIEPAPTPATGVPPSEANVVPVLAPAAKAAESRPAEPQPHKEIKDLF